jgi:hypothetical protein
MAVRGRMTSRHRWSPGPPRDLLEGSRVSPARRSGIQAVLAVSVVWEGSALSAALVRVGVWVALVAEVICATVDPSGVSTA